MALFPDLFPKKKPKAKGLFIPSFLRKVATGSQVADDRTNRSNEDLTQLRYGATQEEVVRDYVKNSPDVSHAHESIMRFTITDSFTLIAKDLETNTINPEVTKLSQMFAARLNRLPIRFDGFSPQTSINSVAESIISQMLTNGCGMSELVLDKALNPSHIQCISTNFLKYESKGDRAVPYIQDTGAAIYLDTPAVCIVSLSQDPETPYASSWFKSAIQSIISSQEFTNDLRKSFRKASLPRVTATVDIDKFKATLAPETLYDPEKFKKALESTLADIENKLNGLNPEDALVNFDLVTIEHLTAGNSSNHENVAVHSGLVNGQMSAGLHVLPSILGRGESQTTASTETVLFLKIVESLQDRLNEIFSYMFTLAARLQGHDVTVTFKFKKPSLRPEMEEETFAAMKQSRILEQCSLGVISDDEMSIALTGDLPSGEFTPLSGTGFHGKGGAATEDPLADNPLSNTSVGGKQVNSSKDQKDRNQGKTKPKTNKTSG
jgi:hypothetical protein